MADEVWTVDEFQDFVRKKTFPAAQSEAERRMKWGLKPKLRFPTEIEAREYCLQRARKNIETAKAELKKAGQRYDKCLHRLEKLHGR